METKTKYVRTNTRMPSDMHHKVELLVVKMKVKDRSMSVNKFINTAVDEYLKNFKIPKFK